MRSGSFGDGTSRIASRINGREYDLDRCIDDRIIEFRESVLEGLGERTLDDIQLDTLT